MKNLVLILDVFVGFSSVAGAKTLLDCNLPAGPDQEMTVIETKVGVILRELTEEGGHQERALSQAELDSRKIKLRESDYGTGFVEQQKDGSWAFVDVAGPSNGFQYIECRR